MKSMNNLTHMKSLNNLSLGKNIIELVIVKAKKNLMRMKSINIFPCENINMSCAHACYVA